MKLAVIFGGISSEHDISCLSAASILRNLDKSKYEIHAVGITREGRWYYLPECDADAIESGAWGKQERPRSGAAAARPQHPRPRAAARGRDRVRPPRLRVPRAARRRRRGRHHAGRARAGRHPVCRLRRCGEREHDGQVADQKRSSRARACVRHATISRSRATSRATPRALSARRPSSSARSRYSSSRARRARRSALPRRTTCSKLAEGLTEAFRMDSKVLVEEFIDGHEVECAVLGNEHPQASTVGEIAPTQEFYTFDAKYKDEAPACTSRRTSPASSSRPSVRTRCASTPRSAAAACRASISSSRTTAARSYLMN